MKGSYIGTCVPMRDLPRYIELYRRGRLPVDRLMSGRLKLEEINAGFDRLREGKAVRQVVVVVLTWIHRVHARHDQMWGSQRTRIRCGSSTFFGMLGIADADQGYATRAR